MKSKKNGGKLSHSRRAQLASQLFVYILGIITVGLLLLLGFRAIDNLQKNQCAVQETKFVSALATAIERNKDWGVNRVETFSLPCDATAVCFVTRDLVDAVPGVNGLPDDRVTTAFDRITQPTIHNSLGTGDDTNVFLQVDNGYKPVERFSKAAPIELKWDEPIRCFSGEPLQIRFKGLGQTVEVVAIAPTETTGVN